MLGWISKRLIMKQPDCSGKLELGAWWPAGLGCNQRQPGRCTPTQSCLLILLQGGWGLHCPLPSPLPPSTLQARLCAQGQWPMECCPRLRLSLRESPAPNCLSSCHLHSLSESSLGLQGWPFHL